MAKLQIITVKETLQELKKLHNKVGSSLKPRVKMLMSIQEGIVSTQELVKKTKCNRNSIASWKKIYQEHGISVLLEENRGGNREAAIKAEQKIQLKQKLSEPEEGFTTYLQAMNWINETFGLDMNYQAVNKYLKRNFDTKLKVGRKTHIKKDDSAVALFKKTT